MSQARYGLPRWVDDRLRGSHFLHRALNKVFPDHWSFMLGEIAMYSFAILVATGIFLTFFYSPSVNEVVYRGPYEPLRGVEMSEAYASVLRLSFEVRAGLVMRQIHHWAALVFVAAIVAHLCRVFFTGAFRRPREINWIIGVTLLVLAIYNGFSGYSLPDDLLSGTGLRIAYSIAESIPFVGTWIAFLAFGGEFPAHDILRRLMITHVLIVPAILAGLLGLHLAIVWRQKHTQFPGPGKTSTNVVGSRLWPTYTAKSVGLLFGLAAVFGLMGGLLQINPVWLYGPYDPATVASPAQPDWYLGWLEGALRLFPPWEIRIFGHVIANPFFPAVLLPGLTFLVLYAWPWIERRITGDRAEHHLLQRPRDNPMRTGVGVAALTFYAILFLAGSNDIIADLFAFPVNAVTWVMRIAVLVLPVVAGFLAYRFMWGLRRTEAESFMEVPLRELVARAGPRSPDGRSRREEPVER
jgi:ubiquinol-cytochrome c reductase cytochrome b subunit